MWLSIVAPTFVSVVTAFSYILINSYIMSTNDLPDMYTQARGPLGLWAWVYISGQITSARDATNMYHS